jgi:uncharacterized membrane protein YdbT with pleckstrin-like domain
MSILDFLKTSSYSFEGKKDDETVILFLHRHWFTLASKLSYIALGIFAPFAVLIILGPYIVQNSLIPMFLLLTFCFYMFIWYMLFYTLTMYTLDTWIVTDRRIINSVQCGFFDRRVSELNLERVQDISIRMEGAVATMIGYGEIEVQTAGAEHRFLFHQVGNPQQVKDEIMKIVGVAKKDGQDFI